MIDTDYFDLHCDTPYECFVRRTDLNDKSLAVNSFALPPFERYKQLFAVWIRDDAENPYPLYKNILNDFKEKIKTAPNNLTAYFSVEGGAVLEDNPERLYELKNDGICVLTLTWNGKNRIASGAHCTGGLTDFGRQVLRIMNEIGMICDLAHINREGFYEAVSIAERPIVTHACCDFLHKHPRNVTDEQLKIIAQKNGLIGLCLYPVFFGDGDVFENVYRHILHLLELDLENSISIGSDFDGADMADTLSDVSKIPTLYRYLSNRGIKNNVLDKIFYKNANNFFVNL